jgi:Holliday junction resolvasome RuvABC endonuclease subunit
LVPVEQQPQETLLVIMDQIRHSVQSRQPEVVAVHRVTLDRDQIAVDQAVAVVTEVVRQQELALLEQQTKVMRVELL